jgi:hypothetical protein
LAGVMDSQFPLPMARKPAVRSRLDPSDRLERLQVDQREAKAQIREILERLAERHGISQKDINYATDGYAGDMPSDFVYSVERDLEHESEAADRP